MTEAGPCVSTIVQSRKPRNVPGCITHVSGSGRCRCCANSGDDRAIWGGQRDVNNRWGTLRRWVGEAV